MEKPMSEYSSQELYDLANEKAAQEKARKQSQVSEQLEAGLSLLNSCTYLKETRSKSDITLYKFKPDTKAQIEENEWFARQFVEELTVIQNLNDEDGFDNVNISLRKPEEFRAMSCFAASKIVGDELSKIDENTYNKYHELYTTCSGIVNKVLTDNHLTK